MTDRRARVDWPAEIEVTVTLDDTARGRPRNCVECALALALNRQFDAPGWSVGEARIQAGEPRVVAYPHKGIEYMAGADLTAAVLTFDGKPHTLPWATFPGTFTLRRTR